LKKKLLATLVLSITASTGAQASTLLGYYSLNGNGVDLTGTGATLIDHGGVTYAQGLSGQAASFDGSGSTWLEASINASGDTVPEFSWGAWVKLTTPNDWNIFLSNDNGGWDRFTQANGGKWSVSNGGVQQSPVSTTSEWTYVSETFNGTQQQLFVNGQLALTTQDGTNDSQHHIDIGRNANGAFPLNGLIQSVSFFSGVLTDAQENTIYQGGANGSGVLLVAGLAPSAVPVPAAIWMFGTGLIGLGAIMRKKAQA
jgi:hypothetical protein